LTTHNNHIHRSHRRDSNPQSLQVSDHSPTTETAWSLGPVDKTLQTTNYPSSNILKCYQLTSSFLQPTYFLSCFNTSNLFNIIRFVYCGCNHLYILTRKHKFYKITMNMKSPRGFNDKLPSSGRSQ